MIPKLEVGQRVVDESTHRIGTIVRLGITICRVQFDGEKKPMVAFNTHLQPIREVVEARYRAMQDLVNRSGRCYRGETLIVRGDDQHEK